jgi:hypothetical protein
MTASCRGSRFASALASVMADLATSRPSRVHPDVDAQSWLGFEQRIQARRFDALISSAHDAIRGKNLLLAQHAIEEAREIRADDDQLRQLEAELRRLRPARESRLLVRRALGAIVLLAAGVSMFIALDATRIAQTALPLTTPPPPATDRADCGAPPPRRAVRPGL